MKRNWKLFACLLGVLFALTACSSQPDPNEFPDITQALGPTATPTQRPTDPPVMQPTEMDEPEMGGESIFSANPYDVEFTEADVLAEENYIDPEFDTPQSVFVTAYPQGTEYAYAGSTPIPLDPVDMPSPTPRPDLTFTYAQYMASTVGVTFEGPVNWQVDETQSSMFILTEPANQMKDGQQAVITISAEPIGSDYDQRDLEKHVEQRLDTIGGLQFDSFKPSYTATRHMLGSTGVYANYSGTLTTGVEVGGRIQYVCIDGVLYGLEIAFPQGFREDFIDVFGQVRTSMSRIR